MPFVFGIIGIILIVSGVRGTVTGSNPNLVGLVKADLTGQPNYTEWMIAIFAVGALGYVPQFKTFSRAFMTAIVIGLILSNKGFFAQLEKEAVSSDASVANPTNTTQQSSSLFGNVPSLDEIENELQDFIHPSD